MMSTFSKGLKSEIKAELSRETFTELRELMDAAFKAEKILSAVYQAYHDKFFRSERVHSCVKVSSPVQQWRTQTRLARRGSPTHDKPSELSGLNNKGVEEQKPISGKENAKTEKKKIVLTADKLF